MPDEVYVHPLTYAALVREIGAGQTYERLSGQGMDGKKAPFGFRALVLDSATGVPLMIMPDADCPRNTAFMLKMSTWCWDAAGDLPGFIDDDGGNDWLRVGTADAMEARIGYYGDISCDAPGQNVRVDLTNVI
jgi:hypothetical protein